MGISGPFGFRSRAFVVSHPVKNKQHLSVAGKGGGFVVVEYWVYDEKGYETMRKHFIEVTQAFRKKRRNWLWNFATNVTFVLSVGW